MRRFTSLWILFLIVLTACESGSAPEGAAIELGSISFPASGSEEAQAHFLQGVAFLHSFEYHSARAAFRQAWEIDPDFVMAYWGEAMTFIHPMWHEENLEAAREAIARVGTPEERAAKAGTELEKGFLQALDVLLGEGDSLERHQAYAEAMGEFAARFPEEPEPAAFHALAILGTAQEGRDFEIYHRAGKVAQKVLEAWPDHPGAAHYVIHSYDDPMNAEKALPAAYAYSKIAPSAPHAMHMPSHIFFALGMWQEAVISNEKAWQVSLDRMEREGRGVAAKDFHALKWLLYCYLQQKRHQDAIQQLEIMQRDNEADESLRTRTHLAAMRAYYLVETADWAAAVPESPSQEGFSAAEVATEFFVDGWRALHRDDPSQARAIFDQMKAAREAAQRQGSGSAYSEGYQRMGSVDTKSAEVMELELEALIEQASGNLDQATVLAREAATRESNLSLSYGPPVPVKPANELLGELLLESGRHEAALAAFQHSLARAPKRTRSLLGLARAAKSHGDDELARQTYQELSEIWQDADPGLAEVSEVRSALAE